MADEYSAEDLSVLRGDEEELHANAAEEHEELEESGPSEDPDKPADETRQRTVPHQALHAEREQRKQYERLAKDREQTIQQMNERFAAALQEQLQQHRNPPAPVPDFNEDPAGHLKWQQDQQAAWIQQQQQRDQQTQQQNQRLQQDQQFLNRYAQDTQSYAKEVPEFGNAYQHLISSRKTELEAAGFAPQNIANIIHAEERMIVENAYNTGVNPGEALLNVARARGYQKQSSPNPLDTVRNGMAASKSLGSSGGGTPKGMPTLQELIKMPATSKEFEKATSDANWNKMMKGR